MNYYFKSRIINYCNQFLHSGHRISVTWLISEDSGEYVRILPFNRHKKKDIALEEQITDLIDRHIWDNAYSFDYISRGIARYDINAHSFIGEERFLETDIFEGTCNIEIKIPVTLYFNQIEIKVTGGPSNPIIASVTFRLRNGNVIVENSVEKERLRIEESLSKIFKKIIPRKDLLNTSNYYKVKRKDFKKRKGSLVFIINAFAYEYKIIEKRDVRIPIL